MFNAKNYKQQVAPNSELTANELKKVLSCLDAVFEREDIYPKKGTFILEHQVYDDNETKRIVEFEFEGGKKKNFLSQGRDSRIMAENMISDASTYSKNPGSAVRYGSDTPLFMSLETTDGRFNAVFFADSGTYESQIIVYCTLAKALSLIIPEDETLQEAWEKTLLVESDYYHGLRPLSDFIEKRFRSLS
jgi:hypothetical protein